MKRTSFAIAIAVALASLAHGAHAASLSYVGQQILPTSTSYLGTQVGGLSGIDYNAATGRYVAISDDRSQINPARYYELALNVASFTRSNAPGNAAVQMTGVTTLLTPAGTPFAANGVDPESIRLRSTPGGTSLLWTNEGLRTGDAATNQAPTLREATLAGAFVRDFAVPSYYAPVGSAGGTTAGDSGIRNNLAFESLTISPDGTRTTIATENALVQDGPRTSLTSTSPSRVAQFATSTGALSAEYIYSVDPIAQTPLPAGAAADRGLVEMLALSKERFLTVERSFSTGVGFDISVYLATTAGATDVKGLTSIDGQAVTPMAKTLLLNLNTLRNDDGSALVLDNVEGISLGPVINGKQTLILVSDNNFSTAEFTQFVALSVDGDLLTAPIPEPQTWALFGAGVAALMARRHRPTPQPL